MVERFALVIGWLAAITAANVITAHYGPDASIVTALCLVGVTLVLRDRLHDLWGAERVPKMAALIATGARREDVTVDVRVTAPLCPAPRGTCARWPMRSTVGKPRGCGTAPILSCR